MDRKISAFGAILVAIGILLGAFGAHALKEMLGDQFRPVYAKAVFYHLVNSIGILSVGLLAATGMLEPRRARRLAAVFGCGVFIFSGTLYLYSITRQTGWAMITPAGGVLLILGWIALSVSILRKPAEV